MTASLNRVSPKTQAKRQRTIDLYNDSIAAIRLCDAGLRCTRAKDTPEQRAATAKIMRALEYIKDREAYREHIESGEEMQINQFGETRWAYPGECKVTPR